MNAIATTLRRLGTVSSLVLLALPVTAVAVIANPVSVNWDAINQAGQANAPIVLNPTTASAPAVPPKTKAFKLTAPKLLNPKNKSALSSKPAKARPSQKLEERLTSKSKPVRAITKQAAPTKKQPVKKVAKKATNKKVTVATKPNVPRASAPVAKAVTPHQAATKTITRAAPTKRIPTKLPTKQTLPKTPQMRDPNFAALMQENLALLPAPPAQTDAQWGLEPANKTLPAAQIQRFNVATFGETKQPQKDIVRTSTSQAPAPTIRSAPKPMDPASSIITTGSTATHQTIANAIEETARELAAIEDAPKHTRTLRSPEPAEGRIVFNVGSTKLMISGRSTLAAVAKKLNQSAARIQLKAYSSQGAMTSASDQRRLSLKRAMAVRRHLTTEFGISSSRIDVRVLGTVEDSGPGDRVDIVMTAS